MNYLLFKNMKIERNFFFGVSENIMLWKHFDDNFFRKTKFFYQYILIYQFVGKINYIYSRGCPCRVNNIVCLIQARFFFEI